MGGTTTQTVSSSSLTGVGNLIKLLPTGTVFLFQFLNPLLTNNGQCDTINKYLTSILLGVCGLSCIFSSFTDSYPGSDGVTHYGVVTLEGLWTLSDSGSENLSGYHLRKTDFVHAFLAVTVFMVVVLMEPNTVKCFYPSFESTQTTLLKVLPIIVGVLSSSVFAYVPCKRDTERPAAFSWITSPCESGVGACPARHYPPDRGRTPRRPRRTGEEKRGAQASGSAPIGEPKDRRGTAGLGDSEEEYSYKGTGRRAPGVVKRRETIEEEG
ncbi:hypothetical protein HHK36_033439 [Tetracentron sinense]|uniref:Uncharacterized protein n=1 Tax=Tetracentron sinense TaxID=13715 RepID=A0A834Y9B5_TETSI|nr:hypothetical protein HHK36_033439 [Tetracentron sinense]